MGKHHVVMGVGIALVVIGFALARTYYVYPGDVGRTFREELPAIAFLLMGFVVMGVGTRMGDGK